MAVIRKVRRFSGGVYDLGLHVVWCPKYRRPVLGGRVAAQLEELIRQKAAERGWEVVVLEVMPDHVHLFVKHDPKSSASYVANQFKGVGHFDTVEFPEDGDGCRWNSTPRDSRTRVRLQGIGHVRVHQHRPVKGWVKTISVKREGKRWYVILACDQVPAAPLPATGGIVGLDMGTVHFFTDSGGEHKDNPRFLESMAGELAAAQQHLDAFPKRRTKKHRAAARKSPNCTRRFGGGPTTTTRPRSPSCGNTT
jgi:REP element-mobilizing transposase RayT